MVTLKQTKRITSWFPERDGFVVSQWDLFFYGSEYKMIVSGMLRCILVEIDRCVRGAYCLHRQGDE
jgi:hypothetical protein